MVSKILHEVERIFPSSKNQIIKLYKCDDHFRSLCEDICDCKKMIKKLRKEVIRNDLYLDEYVELYEELFSELTDKIKKHEFKQN